MADNDPPVGDVTKEWPLEGHFVVGGSGLYVHRDCFGRTFTSNTATYDLTIGLPQIDTRPDPIPPEARRFLDSPAVPRMELIPPVWTYGPRNDTERREEENISPVWGSAPSPPGVKVIPESSTDIGVVFRCRFYTTLTASGVEEFDTASDKFLRELDDWWTRFTSWVGILTGQDFVGLGGNPGGITQAYPLFTWTSDEGGQREGVRWRYFSPPNQGIPQSNLRLSDLQTCVTAAGNQAPPAEWLFIRDARSLLRAGQSRRAVLDAGTAAELAMTVLIDEYLDDTNADEAVGQAFARGWGNLGAKKELLGILRPGLLSAVPTVQTDLIDLRNTASHGRSKAGRRWDDITLEQAQTAVEIASAIVELAHPLAGLLPAQIT